MLTDNAQSNTDSSIDTVEKAIKTRRALTGNEPVAFADIYDEDVNIVTWKRDLSESLKKAADELLIAKPTLQANLTVTPEDAFSKIANELGDTVKLELIEDLAELVDIFCYLLKIKRAGLRMATLDRAMCPKFHVDRVPCRLVTTYQGIATEWLKHEAVDRSKLGMGSNGLPDNESGIYQNEADIQQLKSGDVALLKGESWIKNEGAGLVHRSPTVPTDEKRLLLTLDFAI